MASGRVRQYVVPPLDDFNDLSEQLKARVNEAFDLFDSDKDGRLTYEEFRFVLRALGFDLPKSQTFDMLLQYGQKPPDWGSNSLAGAAGAAGAGPSSTSAAAAGGPGAGGGRSGGVGGNQECSPIYRVFPFPAVQALAGTLLRQRDPVDELRRTFALFDIDNKGVVTQDDLRRVSSQVGSNIPDSDIAAMIDEFDSSGKGGVDMDEFVRLMLTEK